MPRSRLLEQREGISISEGIKSLFFVNATNLKYGNKLWPKHGYHV
jgi:hypothetical protein